MVFAAINLVVIKANLRREVKAKGGKTKSAATIMNDKKHYGISHLIRLTAQNISQSEGVLTLPYYLAYLLEEEF